MAVNTNTTQTVRRSSTVLGMKCEKTQKELKKLMARAGCAPETKLEKVTIPSVYGQKDDVVYAGLNGADFYFRRGECVQMPAPVAQILRDTHVIG